MGSSTPGVFELETSSAPTGARYPMNVTSQPFVERLSASSDLEEKLVTRSRLGTGIRLNTWPHGVSSSRNTREVTPKLASTVSLLNTVG